MLNNSVGSCPPGHRYEVRLYPAEENVNRVNLTPEANYLKAPIPQDGKEARRKLF